jgi:hypothetical protein
MVHSDVERRDTSVSEEGIAAAFLFKGVSVSGPLEELAETVNKKIQMYMKLGEVRNAERARRAHDLARAKLEAVLAAPLSPGLVTPLSPQSCCQAPDSPPAQMSGGEDAANGTL